MIDYLENHLSYRMQVTREDIQMLYGAEAREITRGVEVMPIAGWLANRGGRDSVGGQARESSTVEREKGKEGVSYSQSKDASMFPPLEPEESEELELLLKEILTLS